MFVPRIAPGNIVLGLVALLVASVVAGAATSQGALASQPQPSLRLIAGLGDGIVSANQFVGDPAFPGGNRVRVATGTSVTWTLGSSEPHTVTFPAGQPLPAFAVPQPEGADRLPMLNPALMAPTLPSGPWDGTTFVHFELQGPGQEFSIAFAAPGSFEYVCIFHPEMVATVEVVAAGSAGITTQATVDQYAATHLAAAHASQVAEIMATRNRAERSESRDDTSVWSVRAGTSWRGGHLDILAFLPDSVTIQRGDTVLWYVDQSLPHTITFQPVDGPPLEFVSVQLPDGTLLPAPALGEAPPPELLALLMDPATSPRLVFTGAAAARPSPVHDGRSGYNSGFIGEHPAIAVPMDKTWALTFDAPGTYAYTCVIHEPMGMKGTITVLP